MKVEALDTGVEAVLFPALWTPRGAVFFLRLSPAERKVMISVIESYNLSN